jgi:hypothetical protein
MTELQLGKYEFYPYDDEVENQDWLMICWTIIPSIQQKVFMNC